MSPYRVESQRLFALIRRNKRIELGPHPVADAPGNRKLRAALFGSLPGRVDAGVVDVSSAYPLPGFAARAALGLLAIGLLSLLFSNF